MRHDKIYILLYFETGGKRRAMVEYVRRYSNLKRFNIFEDPRVKSVYITESEETARKLANRWNKMFEKNGTLLVFGKKGE